MIKNIAELALTEERKKLLEILDYGLEETRSSVVLNSLMRIEDNKLHVSDKVFDLSNYKRVFVLGIGKASAEACSFLENLFGEKIHAGYCIDVQERDLKKIELTIGSHPHASEKNYNFTKNAVSIFDEMTEEDLFVSVISGGGSSLFCMPFETECVSGVEIFDGLTKKGATIEDINTVRKHLSSVKGGGLAKVAYPATVISLIFSDVPGDNLEMIASGPTVKDTTTVDDARRILNEYGVHYSGDLFETPKDDKYFEQVYNFLACSNKTTLYAMMKKAKELGIFAKVLSLDMQGDAKLAGKFLLDNTQKGELLLAGGETTVKITGSGKGGRNQQTALEALKAVEEDPLESILISCASDGYDYTDAAGAIADRETLKKAKEMNLNIDEYITNDDSFNFFEKTKDQIMTGKTGINVSDIFLAYKK